MPIEVWPTEKGDLNVLASVAHCLQEEGSVPYPTVFYIPLFHHTRQDGPVEALGEIAGDHFDGPGHALPRLLQVFVLDPVVRVFSTKRIRVLGLDANRVALLTAVMEKKLGMHLMGHDIFMNVAGGVKIMEPAVDMGIVSAIASSFLDKAVPEDMLILGEVGLTGEVRAVGHVDIRALEAAKMGFKRCLIPHSNTRRMETVPGIQTIGVRTVEDALENLF